MKSYLAFTRMAGMIRVDVSGDPYGLSRRLAAKLPVHSSLIMTIPGDRAAKRRFLYVIRHRIIWDGWYERTTFVNRLMRLVQRAGRVPKGLDEMYWRQHGKVQKRTQEGR